MNCNKQLAKTDPPSCFVRRAILMPHSSLFSDSPIQFSDSVVKELKFPYLFFLCSLPLPHHLLIRISFGSTARIVSNIPIYSSQLHIYLTLVFYHSSFIGPPSLNRSVISPWSPTKNNLHHYFSPFHHVRSSVSPPLLYFIFPS